MNFYLPIAEMSANVLVFLGMGASVGFLSGMFGVGGGFLMTPMLIFSEFRLLLPSVPKPHRLWPRRCRGRLRSGDGKMSIC